MSDDNPFDPGETTGQAHDVDVTPVPLDVEPILRRSFDLLAAQPGVVLGAIVLAALPSLLFTGADTALQVGLELTTDDNSQMLLSAASIGVNLLDMLVYLFLQLGLIRLFLGVAYGQPVELGMLVGEAENYPTALGISLVMGIGILFGLLLLIVPGIILAIGLQFALFLQLDRQLGVMDALKASWELTDGYKGTIFIVNLVISVLMTILSCLTMGIGFMLLPSFLVLTQAVMYQSLVDAKSQLM